MLTMEALSQTEIISIIILILFSGSIAGILAGLIGVGGGIVVVPVLFYLFTYLGYNEFIIMHMAVATSLFIIVPTSIRSALQHRNRGAFDNKVFKRWFIPLAFGSLSGSVVASFLSFEVLTLFFAVIAGFVSIQMLQNQKERKLPKIVFSIAPLFIGIVSAMMGIGGGTLSVPIMNFSGIEIKKAIGTSAAFGTVIAIPSSIGFIITGLSQSSLLPEYTIGYINWLFFILIVPVTLIFVPVGVKIAHKISQNILRRLFGLFLGITAVKMFSDLI